MANFNLAHYWRRLENTRKNVALKFEFLTN